MTGIDTNVLVRYLVRDEPKQAESATKFLESSCSSESPGLITLVVLCELVWVLDRGYRYGRAQISDVLGGLLGAADLQVERSELAWQALNRYEDGSADFSDYVIGLTAREAKADVTVTFDRRSAESDLFRLL